MMPRMYSIAFRSIIKLVVVYVFLFLSRVKPLTAQARDLRIATRTLQESLGRFEIGEPEIKFAGKVVELIFPLADEVPDGSVSVVTFGDTECTEDISGNDYLVPSIIYDENPNPDGSKNREVILRYDVDAVKIQKTGIFIQNEKDQFFMNFCTSLVLHNGDAETTNAMVTLETVVLLQVDLLGDFSEEVDVIPNDPSIESARQVYYVEGFLCDENLEQVRFNEPQVQGSNIRVCVKPRDDALADGVYMRRVDSFTFQKDFPEENRRITQVALQDGNSANEALTELNCERGWELCYFDTQLTAEFFASTGIVFGYGEAWLQYGKQQGRKLKIEIRGERNLQQVSGGFAGSSQFGVEFWTIPGEDVEYGAVAYECDRNNRRVDPSPAKELGSDIRVCIAPDAESRRLGITIDHIEDWNWTHDDGATQNSVDSEGMAASDGLTVLHCSPGSELCMFRTMFTPDFFNADGNIKGVANVVMRYPGLVSFSTFRRLQTADEISDLAVVGSAQVFVDTTAKRSKDGVPEHCKFDHKVTEWWEEETMEDRYMYIGVACGAAIAIACSFFLCWCCPCLAAAEEETRDGEEVNVNIGMKSEINENNVQNMSAVQKQSKQMDMDCEEGYKESHETRSKSRNKRSRERNSSGLLIPHGTDSVTPEDDDVCFGDNSHSGTRRLLRMIKRFKKDSPEVPYGPDVYREIRKDMGDIRYLVESSSGVYVEASKKETVMQMGDLFTGIEDRDSDHRPRDSRRNLGSKSGSSKDMLQLSDHHHSSKTSHRSSKTSRRSSRRS